MDVAINAFGVNRLMFGSDWPVCKLAANYEEVCDTLSTFLEQLSEREQELIWSGNANEFYRLNIGQTGT
jgi:L-fuconolactonase